MTDISKLRVSKIPAMSLVLSGVEVSIRKLELPFVFGLPVMTFLFNILSMTLLTSSKVPLIARFLLIYSNIVYNSVLLLFEGIAFVLLIMRISDI